MFTYALGLWLWFVSGYTGNDAWLVLEDGTSIEWVTQPSGPRYIGCHLPRPIKHDIDGPCNFAIYWQGKTLEYQICTWSPWWDANGNLELLDCTCWYELWRK